MTQKSLIKMQILPIKNQYFENPSRNPSNRTKVKILGEKFFGYLSKKILFRVCSFTAEMFEHWNSGKNRRKEAKFFSKIYEGHIRIWFRSKKNSKLSHACVPLTSLQSSCPLLFLSYLKLCLNLGKCLISFLQLLPKVLLTCLQSYCPLLQ